MRRLPAHSRYVSWAPIFILILALPLVLGASQVARADPTLVRTATVQLNVSDSLLIQSNRLAIQQAFLQGNLSAAIVDSPSHYPADYFQLNASAPGNYELRLIFNESSDYNVNLYVRHNDTKALDNSTSYYISGGSFELDVNAQFNPRPTDTVVQGPATSTWGNFANWMGSFGQAFPAWVKALYLLFGAQFLLVGGLWISRETARKEDASQPLDGGDKFYLWLDVAYKFLLTSFVAIVAIMGGELILLFVLRFMFLVSINLLSLWDLFVVGFAAGAVIIVYMIRFTFGKAFDLKPIEDE
jgi:hypothetical protein